MAIQNIVSMNTLPVSMPVANQASRAEGGQQSGFKDMLKQAISEVNEAQNQSDKATAMLAAGGDIDLHEVMITAQKASITMQTALQLRNKAVEAYQEIMRMQV